MNTNSPVLTSWMIELNAVRGLLEKAFQGTIPQDHFTAELAIERERSAGHRADYERERTRADELVAELAALRVLLEGLAQASVLPAQLLDSLEALRRGMEDIRRSTGVREVTVRPTPVWRQPWRRL